MANPGKEPQRTAPESRAPSPEPRDIHAHRILILDFGSQWSQLIARRVREIGVFCELHSPDLSDADIREFAPSGVILSGGPESVSGEDASPKTPAAVFDLGVPVLGICYGMQDMAAQLGGKVDMGHHREFGQSTLILERASALFDGIEDHVEPGGRASLDVLMSHGDSVTELPDGFSRVGRSSGAPIAAMADEERRFYGVQFYPEVTHTRQGRRILERFVLEICGCEARWTPGNIIDEHVASVREEVGDGRVLLGLSGGVDSSVVAALLHEAIGDQLTCVFVDTGLLRLDEGEQVMATFAEHMGVNVIRVDAEDRFLHALEGVTDPEQKRKIIGGLFIEIFDEQAAKVSGVDWLAQGTIYPDVIESAAAKTGKAQVIKSHHNVGGLPETMKLKLIEPLRELFKDEVRRIGVELGLPTDMVYRHPFPGPGLGVRILGEVKKEYADLLTPSTELRKAGHYDQVSQRRVPARALGGRHG